MKQVILTPIGTSYNKLITTNSDQVKAMVEERRKAHPDASFKLPNVTDEYLQFSYDQRLKSLITYGVETKCLVKLTNYDFVDDKKGERIQGAYLQIVAVIPSE